MSEFASAPPSPDRKDRYAWTGRRLFYLAAGVLAAGLLVLAFDTIIQPDEAQTGAPLFSRAALLTSLVLAVIAAVLSSVGLVGPISAAGRRAALTGLIGAVVLFVAGPLATLAVSVFVR